MTRAVTRVGLAALSLFLYNTASWAGDEWEIDYGSSRLGFTASYDEIDFDAVFREFSGRISFDPARIDHGLFDMVVAIGSVDSESPDRDEGMLEHDWFDATRYPDATFVSTEFRQSGESMYSVSGTLTIKGRSLPVTFDFSWSRSGDDANLEGHSVVNRNDFRIGTGEWTEDETIGFDVKIFFDLALTLKP